MNRLLANYVVAYYSRFMTEAERRAQSHLIHTMKATEGRSDALAPREAKHPFIREGYQTILKYCALAVLDFRRLRTDGRKDIVRA